MPSRRLRHRDAPGPHAAVPVSFVDSAIFQITDGSSTTTTTFNKPSGAATGDLLIGAFSTRGLTVLTAPAGWTLLTQVDAIAGTVSAANRVTMGVIYRVLQAGDPGSWNASLSAACRHGTGVVAVRGARAVSPISTYSVKNDDSGANIIHSGITVPDNASLLLGLFASGSNSDSNPPAGGSQRYKLPDGANVRTVGLGWSQAADAGATGNKTGTCPSAAGTNAYAAFLLAVAPA